MIPIGGSVEGYLSNSVSQLIGGQNGIRKIAYIVSGYGRYVSGNGIRPSKHLEGIEIKSVRFIFYKYVSYSKISSEASQLYKRGLAVLRKTLVKLKYIG